jgi:hypothetical protein
LDSKKLVAVVVATVANTPYGIIEIKPRLSLILVLSLAAETKLLLFKGLIRKAKNFFVRSLLYVLEELYC